MLLGVGVLYCDDVVRLVFLCSFVFCEFWILPIFSELQLFVVYKILDGSRDKDVINDDNDVLTPSEDGTGDFCFFEFDQ